MTVNRYVENNKKNHLTVIITGQRSSDVTVENYPNSLNWSNWDSAVQEDLCLSSIPGGKPAFCPTKQGQISH